MADAIRKASADQREAIPGKYQSNKILVEFQRFLAISPRNDGYKANTITYPISYAGKRLHTHRRAGSWIRGKTLGNAGIPPFSRKQKGFRDNPGTLAGGVRGIRTLEPQSATNTLAGCPYRPLRHDSNLELCRSNGATAVYYTTPDELDAPYVAMSPPRNKR